MAVFGQCCTMIIAFLAIFSGGGFYFLRTSKFGRGTFPFTLVEINQTPEDIPDLTGKVIIVTGANVGLGKSTAQHFVINGATTIMACRSQSKCVDAKKDILKNLELKTDLSKGEIEHVKTRFKKDNLITMTLDLGSLTSVKDFANEFQKKYNRLDSLVLNAGIMHTDFALTKDGIESQFGVNHVGHFYLTKLLLPLIEKSAPSTIVAVSSAAHLHPYPEGVRLTLKDINDESKYDKFAAYGQSKIANVLFAQELGERMTKAKKEVYVNALHPGAVRSALTRHYPEMIQKAYDTITGVKNTLLHEPEFAALTEVYAAVNPAIFKKKTQGKYFVPIADEWETSEICKNKELQKNLWEFTEKILKDKGFN